LSLKALRLLPWEEGREWKKDLLSWKGQKAAALISSAALKAHRDHHPCMRLVTGLKCAL